MQRQRNIVEVKLDSSITSHSLPATCAIYLGLEICQQMTCQRNILIEAIMGIKILPSKQTNDAIHLRFTASYCKSSRRQAIYLQGGAENLSARFFSQRTKYFGEFDRSYFT